MPQLNSLMERLLDDWRDDIAQLWRSMLDDIEPDLDAIDSALEAAQDEVVFPGRKGHEPPGAPVGSHVFRALDGILLQNVRAIVVGQERLNAMSYWELPPRLLEEADELAQWARQAHGIAHAAKAKASSKTKRKSQARKR